MSEAAALVPSGIPGLDPVLGGGLPTGSLLFVVGAPGAGKTILASQILCHAARAGTRALILTAFSESPTKLIDHLRPFAFFDPTLMGDRISVLSLHGLLAPAGADPSVALLHAIRETGARLVLIDGFQGLEDILPDPTVLRALLASLATQIDYLDTTLIVTVEGSVRDPALRRLLATADGALALNYTTVGWQESRRLAVIKQRGRAPLPGLHTYTIDPAGITIFPRIEVLPPPPAQAAPGGRAPFGLVELDRLFHGGPQAGTSTVVAGVLGAGKTTLALHWTLAGTQAGEPTVVVSFRETAVQLQAHAASIGLDLQRAIDAGKLAILALSPVELNPDVVAAQLIDVIRQVRARRLVVDDLGPLQLALGPRAPHFFTAVKRHLDRLVLSTLYVLELETFGGFRLGLRNMLISLLGDNVLMLQQNEAGGAYHRVLAVLKMRNSAYDATLRELVIDDAGVRVLTPAESVPGVLAESAVETGGTAPILSRDPGMEGAAA